jgi:uncharacterized membrane protein
MLSHSGFTRSVEIVGLAVEGLGVAVLALGVLAGVAMFVWRAARPGTRGHAYAPSRRFLGRSILLGLEILVAGDIIRTVAVTPTFTSVGVLAIIVVIRTFLSFALEVELNGHWPWSRVRTSEEART